MHKIRLRQLSKLEYRDPRPFLVQLRPLEISVANSNLPAQVKNLRTNKLKPERQLREAAIFCYGLSQLIGRTVYLSPDESQDYDFVARYVADDVENYVPVQLKEVVPTRLNPIASLEKTIESLSKYVDSHDLTVAIHVNQLSSFDPRELNLPELPIAGLWIFGAISEDQSEWGMWGDFTKEAGGSRFAYPT